MKKFLAIVVYRSEVSGAHGALLDFQTRFFEADSEEEVIEKIESEAPCSYPNDHGENVNWLLSSIMAVGEMCDLVSGEELVGFISGVQDIVKLA